MLLFKNYKAHQGGSSCGSRGQARGAAFCPQDVGFLFLTTVPAAALSDIYIRWRDGFSIDGGELRHYSDPGSREFMVCWTIQEVQSFKSFSGFSDERIHPGGAGERSKRGGGACGHGGPQVGGACFTQCLEVQTEFIQ